MDRNFGEVDLPARGCLYSAEWRVSRQLGFVLDVRGHQAKIMAVLCRADEVLKNIHTRFRFICIPRVLRVGIYFKVAKASSRALPHAAAIDS